MDMELFRDCFERVERVEDLVITRGGEVQQRFGMARAWNLKRRPNVEKSDAVQTDGTMAEKPRQRHDTRK